MSVSIQRTAVRPVGRLRGADLAVLLALVRLRYSVATSYTQLAQQSGYSRPTVQRAIDRLVRSGYITVLRGGTACSNHYTITAAGWHTLTAMEVPAAPDPLGALVERGDPHVAAFLDACGVPDGGHA